MATGITDTDLEDLLECPLCFEKFRKHRILPCGHTFCEECLKEHARTTIRPGGRFSCPSCREEIILPKGGVERFPYNFTINKLHDMLENAEGKKVQVSCKKHRPSESPSTSQCRSQDSEVAGGNRTPKKPFLEYSIPLSNVWDVALCQDGSVIVLPYGNPVREYSRTGVLKKLTQIDSAYGVAELPDGNIAFTKHSRNHQKSHIEVYNRNWQYIYSPTLDSNPDYGRIAVLNNDTLAVSFPFQSCIKVYTGYRNKEFLKVVAVIKEITTETQTNRRWYAKQLFLNAAFVVLLIPVVDPPVAFFLLSLVITLLLVALVLWKKKHLRYPQHITAYGENGLIVSDPKANAVYAFTARGQGEYTCEWMYGGVKGSGPGMLWRPSGVATNRQGQVLIADTVNHRVLLLSPDGEMLMELLTRNDGLCCPGSLRAGSSTLAVTHGFELRIYEYL